VPSSDPVQRFQDIIDNIARTERFTAGLNSQTFAENEQTIYAVKHALLIISEAAVKLGSLAPDLCPGIDWRDVRALGIGYGTNIIALMSCASGALYRLISRP
jgi:uncharacterized protein with HEPN domain